MEQPTTHNNKPQEDSDDSQTSTTAVWNGGQPLPGKTVPTTAASVGESPVPEQEEEAPLETQDFSDAQGPPIDSDADEFTDSQVTDSELLNLTVENKPVTKETSGTAPSNIQIYFDPHSKRLYQLFPQ